MHMIAGLMFSALATAVVLSTATAKKCFSDENFAREFRFARIEVALKDLKAENRKLKELSLNLKAELEATRNAFVKCPCPKSTNTSNSWAFKRVEYVFPSLSKIQQSLGEIKEYREKIPSNLLSDDTRAVVIAIFCHFVNRDNSHAYMDITFHQKGNSKSGKAKIKNFHFNVYSNSFYNEVMIPWNPRLGDEAVFRLENTWNDGKSADTNTAGTNQNWYTVKMVGYVSV